MKKIIKWIIPAIIFLVITNFISYPVKAEESPQKGDLRCPPQYKNKGCVEITENGEVVEARVTSQVGNATITKHVRKTDTPGEVQIWFEVNGKPQPVTGDAYIMVILDASTTMGSKYKNYAVPAAKSFAKSFDLANNKNIYLGELSFNNKGDYAKRGFENQDFEKFNFKDGNKLHSHLYLALNKAKEMFEKTAISTGAKKFVVILGDGKWNWNTISGSVGYQYLKNSENNFTIYSIGFGGASEPQNAQKLIDVAGSSDRYVYAGTDGTGYQSAFQDIYKKIAPQIVNNKVSVSIKDKIGESFNIVLSSMSSKTQTFTSDTLPFETEKFTIRINSAAEDGWHETNENFKFNNDTFEISPEIYWKQEVKEWRYCSDTSFATERIDLSTDYYVITCDEGYQKTDGYHADLTVNNLPISTNKFNIANGSGFPIKISISDNIKCTYEFDTTKFNKDYNELNSQLSKTSDPKDKADIAKEIDILKNVLTKYKSKLKELSTYSEDFKNQKALLNVKYKNSQYKELYFIDNGDFTSNLNCDSSEVKTENVLGQSIETNKICILSVKKSMQLPLSCLSMEDGESEDCVIGSDTQISGGNNFYVPLDVTGGYVSVFLDNATFSGADIKLEGEKKNGSNPRCEFTNETSLNNGNLGKAIFRQIDVVDPFIQTYTKTRKIGTNWSNSKYNFVKTIKSDIWSGKSEYEYSMSKTNIEAIKSDTASIGVNSYLGTDCKFNNNGSKYLCSFVRGNNGVSNYFTYFKIND